MYTLTFSAHGKTQTIEVPHFADAALLPEASRNYIWEYGMKQTLADSFARAKDAAEFEAFLATRWEKIQAGTMAIRAGGSTDPVQAEIKKIVSRTILAAYKKKGLKVPTTDEQKAAFVKLCETYRAAHAERLEEEAKAIVAAREASVEDVDLEALGLSID